MRTESEIIQHYWRYGVAEGRTGRLESRSGRLFVIDLNLTGTCGFTNQLNVLINAIIQSHYTGRVVGIKWFYPTYNSRSPCRFDKVVDVPKLREEIKNLGLNTEVRIVEDIDSISESPDFNENDYRCGLEIVRSYLRLPDRNIKSNSLFNPYIYRDTMGQFTDIYYNLFNKLPFAEEFHHVVERMREERNITNHNTLHLRLVDNIGRKLFKAMRRLFRKDDPVYIIIDFGEDSNAIIDVLNEISREYPNTFTSKGWRESNPHIQEGREIDALIDWLLGRRGESFIGAAASTYSTTMDTLFTSQRRPSLSI